MGRRSASYNNGRDYQHPVAAKKTASRKRVSQMDQDLIIPVQPSVRKSFHLKDLLAVTPLTQNQEHAFEDWDADQNLVLDGPAGTGKTFLALYMALTQVLDPESPQKKIIIAKTPVQGYSVGFLPGTEDDKVAPFEAPYKAICAELFPWKNSYDSLKEIGLVEYEPMVAVRGQTFHDQVIIIEEFQNMTPQQLETIITRAGRNTRVILCGDDCQNDIGKTSGGVEFLKILKRMRSFSFVNFELQDIVRSGLCREFLMAKYQDKY